MDSFKMDVIYTGCLITIFTMGIGFHTVSGDLYSRDAALLHNVLLSGYQPEVIPMTSHDTPVILKIYPTLVNVDSTNAIDNVMEAALSMTMTWRDYRLQWDPAKFGNISEIYTQLQNVWRPDVRVHDMGQGENVNLFDDLDLAVVSNTGSVTYARISNVKFLCSTDYWNFPFDERRCYVTIGSWLYTARRIKMEFWHTYQATVDLNIQADKPWSHITSSAMGQWTLVGDRARGVMQNVTHACCPDDPNTLLEMTLQLGREPGLLAAVLLLSVIVPAVLVPLHFCLSPMSDTRLMNGFVVLLLSASSSVYLLSVFPVVQSRIPKIGISMIGNVCTSTLALVFSIVLTSIYQHGTEPPPTWLSKLVSSVQPLVCVKGNRQPSTSNHPSRHSNEDKIWETIPLHQNVPLSGNRHPSRHSNGDNRGETIPLHQDLPGTLMDQEHDNTAPASKQTEDSVVYKTLVSFVEHLRTVIGMCSTQPHIDWGVIVTVADRVLLGGFTVLSIVFVIITLSCI